MHGRSGFAGLVLAAGCWLLLSGGIDLAGPGLRAGEGMMEVDTLIYHYGDSSVPPPYHRSYTITLDASKAELVVDSYGDVVHREQKPFAAARWPEVQAWLKAANPRHCPQQQEAPPCTGGTSESLRLLAQGRLVFEGSVYHCQGDWGDLCADLAPLTTPLRRLFDYFPHPQ